MGYIISIFLGNVTLFLVAFQHVSQNVSMIRKGKKSVTNTPQSMVYDMDTIQTLYPFSTAYKIRLPSLREVYFLLEAEEEN